MLAGPSEILVIADSSSDPAVVAADLIAQAEHDPDSAAILVAVSVDDRYPISFLLLIKQLRAES